MIANGHLDREEEASGTSGSPFTAGGTSILVNASRELESELRRDANVFPSSSSLSSVLLLLLLVLLVGARRPGTKGAVTRGDSTRGFESVTSGSSRVSAKSVASVGVGGGDRSLSVHVCCCCSLPLCVCACVRACVRVCAELEIHRWKSATICQLRTHGSFELVMRE